MKFLYPILALILACTPGFSEPAADRPNIILIISDDQAFSDYTFMGSKIAKTPHLDDETLTHITDFPATILKIAKVKAPTDIPGLDLPDRDAMTKRKSIFVESYCHDIADLKDPGKSLYARVVIDDFSKLIIPGPAKPTRPFHTIPTEIELYDLKADPLENSNLTKERPDEVKRLMAIQDSEWDGK